MSGTSMDGVDAALCRIDAQGLREVVGVQHASYPPALRARLLALQLAPDQPLSLREFAQLDHAVAEVFAEAALAVVQTASTTGESIAVIGSHGQTVFHDPASARNTLQIGDPNLIAARTGIAVAADFRRADIALGGQGAPLVPAFHQACFGSSTPCAVLNLGGIANLSLLNDERDILGFDTGPGNGLMDSWIQRHRGAAYDHDGAWAASGQCNAALLQACLDDPYFALPPPKSTGRDQFNLDWLAARFTTLNQLPEADVQHTLCELTAQSVALQLQRWGSAVAGSVFVCGGGARNRQLMAALQRALPDSRIAPTREIGLDGDVVEAAAFAWLAWRRLHGLSGNLPTATGALRPAVLGGLYLPPR